ncbi:hypothetical protein THRCLA_09275 [Thraustotheca clavata]|uniref:Secreted protein n=1 Tax=Thraustotheca clavata TaxID=74557 RepID=A0A0A7CML9_9STRA|nr:secreted protein [Thraustotheca clavata]OQR90575.1 hypothetical protein THRCLA_09275 [Thraustotheca clavata]
MLGYLVFGIAAVAAQYIHSVDDILPVNTNQVHYENQSCKVVLMDNYVFGASYGKPFQGSFAAPSCIEDPENTAIYLRWSASVPSGRQFDRIAALWVNGFELLRTTTQEPSRKTGATWEVVKDISTYKDIFAKGGNVVVALDNVVDQTYTSSFTITLTAEFYKPKDSCGSDIRSVPRKPDSIVSISNKNGPYGWFNVQPSTLGANFGLVSLPQNMEQLFLEVFLSHHGCDEFWYTNPPNKYLVPLQTNCGNGAFREVQILIDGDFVGAIWPFPLIYTGGISPYMWRPIVATNAFEAPTYLADLTPFLGKFLDGKAHNVSFGVGFGLDYWPMTGNLLVYVDKNGNKTTAQVQSQSISPGVVPSVGEDVKGLDMTFKTTASRKNSVSTLITTSKGSKVYSVVQEFTFFNDQIYTNNASTQWFDQRTQVTTTTSISYEHGHTSKQVVQEDYPFSGNTTYITYSTGQTESIPHRVEFVDIRRNIKPEATEQDGYQLTTSIDHAFKKSIATSGNAQDFLLGLSDYTVFIKQHANAYLDSNIGGNGTNSAQLRASNSTGCYSHKVEGSVNGGITMDIQGNQCP